jgi:hypothetical protein
MFVPRDAETALDAKTDPVVKTADDAGSPQGPDVPILDLSSAVRFGVRLDASAAFEDWRAATVAPAPGSPPTVTALGATAGVGSVGTTGQSAGATDGSGIAQSSFAMTADGQATSKSDSAPVESKDGSRFEPAPAGGPDDDDDGDGLTNVQEVRLGTDPRYFDSDHDGVSDAAEVKAGTNPVDPDSDHGAS